MVMDMGWGAEQGVVELVYQPVAGDFSGALRERRRFNRAGKIQRWTVGFVAVALSSRSRLRSPGDTSTGFR
jgi:hypothetical protein